MSPVEAKIPGTEPVPPALVGEVLIPGLPRKFLKCFKYYKE